MTDMDNLQPLATEVVAKNEQERAIAVMKDIAYREDTETAGCVGLDIFNPIFKVPELCSSGKYIQWDGPCGTDGVFVRVGECKDHIHLFVAGKTRQAHGRVDKVYKED